MGKVKKAGAARKQSKKGKKGKRRKTEAPPPSTFEVRGELDPVKKCGPDTSVQLLYRIDEQAGKLTRPHLVFFDRHGWYCEHGRNCPAVSHAKRDAKLHHAHLVLAYDKLDRIKTAG